MFWCVEAIFLQLAKESVVSGYTGGHIENPMKKFVQIQDMLKFAR